MCGSQVLHGFDFPQDLSVANEIGNERLFQLAMSVLDCNRKVRLKLNVLMTELNLQALLVYGFKESGPFLVMDLKATRHDLETLVREQISASSELQRKGSGFSSARSFVVFGLFVCVGDRFAIGQVIDRSGRERDAVRFALDDRLGGIVEKHFSPACYLRL